MKHRPALCLALILALALPVLPAKADPPIYTKLVVPVLFEAEIPRDVARINEAVNEITREKIGAEVQLIPLILNAARTNQDRRKLAELEMLQKQGTRFDVLPDSIPNAAFIPLDGLLAQYGQDILRTVEAQRFAYSWDNAQHDRLPSVSDFVASAGLTMRKDIVEKYQIDLTQLHTLADLDALFAYVKAREPAMHMVCGYRTGGSFIYRFKFVDAVEGSVCDQAPGDPTQLVNYYATDQYRDTIALIRRWNLSGYVPSNLALQNMTSAQLVRAGELFSYFSAYKPGIEYEESLNCGTDMVTISLMEPVVTQHSLALHHWGIASTCTNPGKAMMFLNLLYTDCALVNLLIYGIEGVHYAVQPDGTINYPEGVTQDTVGYRNNQPWLFPNQLVSHVWQGNDPLLWAKTAAFNAAALPHDALTFTFDDTAVAAENEAINAIARLYAYGLETGQLDPDVYLPQMLSEMDAAGIDRVVAEAQAQFDAWRGGKEAP